VLGCCEHGNEHSGTTNARNFCLATELLGSGEGLFRAASAVHR